MEIVEWEMFRMRMRNLEWETDQMIAEPFHPDPAGDDDALWIKEPVLLVNQVGYENVL